MTIMELLPVQLHRHTVFVANAEAPLVPIRPVCLALGLDESSQRQKLQSHPTFAPTAVMITSVAGDGKQREMYAMPADMVMGWLLTIHPNKVAPRVRSVLVEFQRHIYRSVYDTWMMARAGLPAHPGGRPRQGALFEAENPMKYLRHPTVQEALRLWDSAAAVEADARSSANDIREASRALARRVGLSGRAFSALREWSELGPQLAPASQNSPALEG